MGCYASYYKIKEIMIDPYYDEDGNELPNDDAEGALESGS
jgi:hypothetical protein